ncbi:hypothetical protein RHS01_03763 [Rhizoctonia solani]|uniref:Uncharacterized protein n=1 Tax=Rhizoctonia solani TaxID=456999 RepID=A0A8H7IGK0_9AGAM|nr:hypothetical protein RHS01_03763 [Rhizoctonia solani]
MATIPDAIYQETQTPVMRLRLTPNKFLRMPALRVPNTTGNSEHENRVMGGYKATLSNQTLVKRQRHTHPKFLTRELPTSAPTGGNEHENRYGSQGTCKGGLGPSWYRADTTGTGETTSEHEKRVLAGYKGVLARGQGESQAVLSEAGELH